MKLSYFFIAAILLIALPLSVDAQIPRTLSYQGILTDTSGNPKPDGFYTFTFRLYETSSGGSAIWTEIKDIQTRRGLFYTTLGDVTPFEPIVRFDRPYWLSVKVAAEPELSPRIPLTSVGYSFTSIRSDTAQHALSAPVQTLVDSARIAGTIPDNTVTSAKITDGTIQRVDAAANFKAPYADSADVALTALSAPQQSFVDSARIAGTIPDNIVTSAKILDTTIQFVDIGQNSAFNGQVIKWNGAAWAASNDNEGTGLFLPLAGGTMTGAITNVNDPSITMGKGNFGFGNINTGTQAFVAGSNNRARGQYSVVGGGGGAAVSDSNSAIGDYSTVGGGRRNKATLDHATVGGGFQNTASGFIATVGGGGFNKARGQFSVVSGGGGGTDADSNSALGDYSTVGGGRSNTASGSEATVGGGRSNTASSSFYATVGGGNQNTASSFAATVGGGQYDTASNFYATVGGGYLNTASGDRATVGGGNQNTASSNQATVGGGYQNTASGLYATVGGGYFNTASNLYATVGGGVQNTASGFYATVPGGLYNAARGNYSFSAGLAAKANHAGSVVIAANSSGVASDSAASGGAEQMVLRADDGVFITDIAGSAPATVNILQVLQNSLTDPLADGWTTYSSRRWKTNIRTIDEALDKVINLRGVYYDWKADGKHDVGLIAEEVGEVIPEVVAYEENGIDAQSVDYARLVAVLIEAVKEQQKEIEKLKTAVKLLERNSYNVRSAGGSR